MPHFGSVTISNDANTHFSADGDVQSSTSAQLANGTLPIFLLSVNLLQMEADWLIFFFCLSHWSSFNASDQCERHHEHNVGTLCYRKLLSRPLTVWRETSSRGTFTDLMFPAFIVKTPADSYKTVATAASKPQKTLFWCCLHLVLNIFKGGCRFPF